MKMADIEKTIKGLEYCTINDGINDKECKSCPYYERATMATCWIPMNRDALELLKEKYKKGHWVMNSNFPDRLICSECSSQFDVWHFESKQMHFCPNCGADMRKNESH